ncbi:MAG TPA: glutamate racemase [Stellaceae bacterium]|jgi:glutamate racemase
MSGSSTLESPIGVFDSGVGGLTVLRALRQALPDESMLYLGDTARLPYGTKSGDTIVRYALQAAGVLVERGAKLLVIACNTASAYALDALRDRYPHLPVIGVVEPGAATACAASWNGRIAVIATEGTARAGAYDAAIRRLRPDALVTSAGAPLLVGLAEEGWFEGPVPEAVARRYLAPLFETGSAAENGNRPDTLVLGCTHFPLLRTAIQAVVGPDVALVDGGMAAASLAAEALAARGLAAPSGTLPATRFLATDGAERFARVAQHFLSFPIDASMVEVVDLQAIASAAA